MTDNTFVPLPNWPGNDRCRALRPYKDQLVALGVTKEGTFYPTMVRWSDFAYFGDVPGSWDPSDPTKSAGENIVNGMDHPLVDGAMLRDSFILYCTSSVWLMDYTGDSNIYRYQKIFDERGIINRNCVVSVGGMHYVFDRDDIYVHDGVSDRSICDDRSRRFIFDSLDFSRPHVCFVQHDARLNEVRFAYASQDDYVGFGGATTGCNRQAVYNYGNQTWTFYDVPNIVATAKAALVSGVTWEDDQVINWDNFGGPWLNTEDNTDRHILVAGRADPDMGLTASRIYGQDPATGGRLLLPVEPETLRAALVERTGIDLDLYGKHLTQHVNIQAIWPQISMDNWEDCFWQFGGENFFASTPTWSPQQTFDPATETKIDVNEKGKYLAYRFECGGSGDFSLSSFDIKFLVRGRR